MLYVVSARLGGAGGFTFKTLANSFWSVASVSIECCNASHVMITRVHFASYYRTHGTKPTVAVGFSNPRYETHGRAGATVGFEDPLPWVPLPP